MTFIIRSPEKINPEKVGDIALLCKILSWKRQHNSESEQQFAYDYLDIPYGMESDKFGNRFMRIGNAPIAFCCHIDTCHHEAGYQRLAIHEDQKTNSYKIKVADPRGGTCLGADDGAGVFLLLQLIKARVPGLYLFHRGEEVGCQGSKDLSRNNKHIVSGIKHMIALDRRGFDNVITHQRSRRCCSDDFANALGKAIGGEYKPDPTGVYTDSAEYTELVPECTNLSVGYDSQHGPMESQHIGHIRALASRLIRLNWANLPVERDPKKEDTPYQYKGYSSPNYHNMGTHSAPGWSSARWNFATMSELLKNEAYLLDTFMTRAGFTIYDIKKFLYQHDTTPFRDRHAIQPTKGMTYDEWRLWKDEFDKVQEAIKAAKEPPKNTIITPTTTGPNHTPDSLHDATWEGMGGYNRYD